MSSYPVTYDGQGYHVLRGNQQPVRVIQTQTYTASTSSPVQTNPNCRGVMLIVSVYSISGTSPTLTVFTQAYDSITSEATSLNTAPTAITATGTYIYVLYPGASGTGVAQATSLPLPYQWMVYAEIGGTSPSIQFSVDALLLV